MNFRGTCIYYEIAEDEILADGVLAEYEIMNIARFLELLKKLMDRWHGNQKQAVW